MISLESLLLPLLALVAGPPAVLGATLLLGVRWHRALEARIAATHAWCVLAATVMVLWQ
jgi:hypothetical protein